MSEMCTYVKREFDCGHYTLVPGYFADDERCPVCDDGRFVKETEPTEEEIEEAEWL